jgi:hypothetical protein
MRRAFIKEIQFMYDVFSNSGLSDQAILSRDPKGSLPIPVSFFNSVLDVGVKRPFFMKDDPKASRSALFVSEQDADSEGFTANAHFLLNETTEWGLFLDGLRGFAETEYTAKGDAPLFSPTIYRTLVRFDSGGKLFKGFRNEPNAITSALVVIDADKGFDLVAAERCLTEHKIESVLYTTANNKDGTRFRIVVPLLAPVDPETHKAVVNAVCAFLKPGWKPDTSKNNCYSLFYVPGRYAGANNRFVYIVGSIFPAKAWLQLGGQVLGNGSAEVANTKEAAPVTTTWNSSFDCPYVDQQWVNEYLDLTDDFYNGLFQFVCRVALSALRQGIELSAGQLAELARDVESMSGRKHKSWDIETRDLEGEAANALDFARAEIARTPSPNERKIERCGKAMSFVEWAMSDDTGRIRPVADQIPEQPPNPTLEWDAGLDNGFIEPRQWLLGNTFARRYVSTIVADGGTGKTALRLAEAIALATGRPITGEHVFHRCRVLYVSLEDDADEMRRRITACCLHHKIDRAELQDHLFAVALANGPKLATMIKGGTIAPGELGNKLIEIIERRNIDLVVLDPFIKSHGCDENDNNAIDFVTGMLAELAIRFNVSIDAPHHVSKGTNAPGNANRGRGASAFKDAARLVYTLSKMTLEEAKELGVEERDRWRYVRVDSAKVNIAPTAATATWFRLVGVPLGNASVVYPSGDEVQTVEPWAPVDLTALANDSDLRSAILAEIENAPPHALYSAHPNSGQRHVFQIFKRHLSDITKKQTEKMVNVWIDEGRLRYVSFQDDRSRDRQGLALCE